MKPFGRIAIALLLALSPAIAAQSARQAPPDLRELFKHFRYRLKDSEQQSFIGKRYSGAVLVSAPQQDKATGTVTLHSVIRINSPAPAGLPYFVHASFQMNSVDAKKAVSIQEGEVVRITGRLARLDITAQADDRAPTIIGRSEFVDASLDEIVIPKFSPAK